MAHPPCTVVVLPEDDGNVPDGNLDAINPKPMSVKSVPSNHSIFVGITVKDNENVPSGIPKAVQIVRNGLSVACEFSPQCRCSDAVDFVPDYGHIARSEVPRGHPIQAVAPGEQQEEYHEKTQLFSQHIQILQESQIKLQIQKSKQQIMIDKSTQICWFRSFLRIFLIFLLPMTPKQKINNELQFQNKPIKALQSLLFNLLVQGDFEQLFIQSCVKTQIHHKLKKKKTIIKNNYVEINQSKSLILPSQSIFMIYLIYFKMLRQVRFYDLSTSGLRLETFVI